MYAAEFGLMDVIKLLAPLEIGLQDKYGQTALMYACYFNRPDCVSLLLSEAGKRNFKMNKTALMFAAESGCLDAVK